MSSQTKLIVNTSEDMWNNTAPIDNYYEDDEEDQRSSSISDSNQMASSFRTSTYHSEEMKKILELDRQDEKQHLGLNDVTYKSNKIFPDWCLKSNDWRAQGVSISGNEIADIFQTPSNQRSNEQKLTLIEFICEVWPKVAGTMGIKRVGMMVKEFKYLMYEAGTTIITEGEVGQTFYIIISGEVDIMKSGAGKVGHMGKGKSFGELALTQFNAKRAATIRTTEKTEVLSLHKIDYDHFVKDIQFNERREHFHCLRDCHLFDSWPRAKIEKMAGTCTRKAFEAGHTIFNQGDEPDYLYFILEGSVNILKTIQIICKNRWPSGPESWEESKRKTEKYIIINTLNKGSYFGELAILQKVRRTATAVANSKVTLVAIDKHEFLHQLVSGVRAELRNDVAKHYTTDKEVLKIIDHVSGGPSSQAIAGDVIKYPNANATKMIRVQAAKKFEQKTEVILDDNYDDKSANSELLEQQLIDELRQKINKSSSDSKKSKKKKIVIEGQPNLIKQILIKEINEKLQNKYTSEMSVKRADAEQEVYKLINENEREQKFKAEKDKLLNDSVAVNNYKGTRALSREHVKSDVKAAGDSNIRGVKAIHHTSLKFSDLPTIKAPNRPQYQQEIDFQPIALVPYKPVTYDHIQGKNNYKSKSSPRSPKTATSAVVFTKTESFLEEDNMNTFASNFYADSMTRTRTRPTTTSLSGAITGFERLPSPSAKRLHSASSAALDHYKEHQDGLHKNLTVSNIHTLREKKAEEAKIAEQRRLRVLSQHLPETASIQRFRDNNNNNNNKNNNNNNTNNNNTTTTTAGELIISKDPRTPVYRTRGKIEDAVFGESGGIRPAYQPPLKLLTKQRLSYADIMNAEDHNFMQNS